MEQPVAPGLLPGTDTVAVAAQYMGRQIFKSQEYADRGRDNHWYVYDLYWAYLQRQPDTSGWNFWEGVINSDIQNGLDGREHARVAFETDGTEFFPKLASLCAGSSAAAPIPLDGLANLTYDAATNHITTAGFTYDAAGNQTRTVRTDGSAQRFQYDAANRLIQVRDDFGYTLEAFTYGDSNERLITEEGSLRTYYACDGSAEYLENVGSTTPAWSKSYVYLGGRLLATLIPNGSGGEAVQYHHPDRLGTRLVTDPSNGTSFEQVTLPFGTPLNAESTGATNRRFTSYDRSTTIGLDYANNRHYDSQQGRFTQVDPIGMSASSLASPQSLNLYAYCGNDPINRVDPSGLFWGKLLGFVNKVIKWLKVAVAVAIIVLTIMLAPELAGIAIAKALALAGALLGSALGPRWLQTAITVGFAALGIYLQGPQIIWNFAQAGASVSDRVLSAIGWLNVVGTVTRYLGGTPQNPADEKPPDGPLDIVVINHKEPRDPWYKRLWGGLGGFYNRMTGDEARFRAARWDQFWYDLSVPRCAQEGKCRIGIFYPGASPTIAEEELTLAPRVLEHADVGAFHRIPTLVVNKVLNYGQVTVKSSTYVEYTMPGVVNGTSGVYEIGVNPATNEVVHRFFRPR